MGKDGSTQAKPLCSPDLCACRGEKCNYVHKQYGLNKWVFRLILFTIFLGIIVPFATEAILPIFFQIEPSGLNTWNQFASIILGIIATVLSIVSIIMGFKNYEDTLAVQEKYMEALQKISNMAQDLTQVRDEVKRMAALRRDVEDVEVPSSKVSKIEWEEEPKEAPADAQKSDPVPSKPIEG